VKTKRIFVKNKKMKDKTDMNKSTDIQYQQEVFEIIGAAMEVQNHLGRGFLELVYHEALNIELGLRGIPFETEKLITIAYKGHLLERTYKADLVCYENIVVELKSVEKLKTEHTAQLLNYLKATNLPLGILINFGETPLKYKIVPNFINQK
jgi:GxxExxY protein